MQTRSLRAHALGFVSAGLLALGALAGFAGLARGAEGPYMVSIEGADPVQSVVVLEPTFVHPRGNKTTGDGSLHLEDGSSYPLVIKAKLSKSGWKVAAKHAPGSGRLRFSAKWTLNTDGTVVVGDALLKKLKNSDGARVVLPKTAFAQALFPSDEPAAAGWDGTGENALAVHEDGSVLRAGPADSLFIAADGTSVGLVLGEDGMPTRLASGDTVVLFDQWRPTLVDLAILHPDGSIELHRNQSVDGVALAKLSYLRGVASHSGLHSLTSLLSTAGLWYSTISCLMALPTGVGAILPCAGTVVGWAAELVDSGLAEELLFLTGLQISRFETALSCAAADWFDCFLGIGLLSNDILNGILDDLHERQDDLTAAEGALSTGGGALQINLTWDNTADLDLHVTDPHGFEIYYANDTSPSGGYLDVDDVSGFGPENIFWNVNPPSGTYTVEVNHYSGESPASFRILISKGSSVQSYTGTVSAGQKKFVATVSMP